MTTRPVPFKSKVALCLITLLLLTITFPVDGHTLVNSDGMAEEESFLLIGERPPVIIDKVPADAFEQGKIYVKFTPMVASQVKTETLMRSGTGAVMTGNAQLDQLNQQYQVEDYKPLFGSIYSRSSVAEKHRKRHEAWGFDDWFELRISARQNVIEVVKAFEKLKDVEIAEPVYKIRHISGIETKPSTEGEPGQDQFDFKLSWVPDDPHLDKQWHYHNTGQHEGTKGADIDLVRAWDIEKGSDAVIVAVIDSGIQYDHPDLAGNMWADIGYNFVDNNSTILPHNHGTHVAGTVAAVSHNGVGVAGIAGGSGSGDGVRLMSLQVFTSTSNGGFHIAPVWAADNGAAISQNSWGYTKAGVYNTAVLDAIDYFNAHGGGTVLDGGITIFAAGNDNDSGDWYPGSYSGAMAVAATNNNDQKAFYSTYGSWVEISAPGGETHQEWQRGVLSTITGSGYAYYQGTSMACPHVSGVAALMVSMAPGAFSAEDIRTMLKETADDHYAVNPLYLGQLGTGRLNAYQALLRVQNELFGTLINPGHFTAAAVNTSEISLSWNKNQDNDDVLVLWSADGAFGVPVDGTEYLEGQAIAGGGTVLYMGSDISYSHKDLSENTAYYYRAFSYDTGNNYSSGVTANVTTEMGPITLFPWKESFEEDSETLYFWSVEYVSGNTPWYLASGAGGGSIMAAHEGLLNARFTSNSYAGDITRLISPQLDISVLNNPKLSFWYGQERWYEPGSDGWDDQNELKVYYRTGPNAAWVEIFHDDQNRPEWTKKTLDLPNPSSSYQVAFEGICNWGYANVIDEVTVTQSKADYDFSLSLKEGWSLVSIPFWYKHLYIDSADIDGWLAYRDGVWFTGSYRELVGELNNPAKALFIKTAKEAELLLNWADITPETEFAGQGLYPGWNLISSGLQADYLTILAGLHDEGDGGLTQIFAPNSYNGRKQEGYYLLWESPLVGLLHPGEDIQADMFPFDGYWVFLKGEELYYSTPVGNDLP